MDESSNESSGERKSQEPEAAKSPANKSAATSGETPQHQVTESKASDSNLPVVWSPKLDAGAANTEDFPQSDADEAMSGFADETVKEETSAPTGETAGQASPPRSLRFAMLAASVAFAAAFGSFVGSLSASGVAHLWPASAPSSSMAAANTLPSAKAELAELAALKANLDGAARNANGNFAKLADRLDRVERAQSEPVAKLAHIAEAVDRLEKKTVMASAAPAAPETTGSIANSQPPASTEAKLPDKILQEWIVQDVRGGHALVESAHGGIFAVVPGSVLPGLGRVETIKRQDGQWVVVTARGIITEH
jgi:hypothetical protein